ncbi:MAG: FAD-dependent oxidoreductase [Pseudohongiellaceae bacterium]|nr:FAD-dependent oxidoreductase [Pseudohongiellaceae bacterium]
MSVAVQPTHRFDQHNEVRKDSSLKRIIVVGNGPVGVHFVNQLFHLGWDGELIIFGEEESPPYNRVQLSAFLNREISFAQLQNPLTTEASVVQKRRCRVVEIQTDTKTVVDQYGETYEYTHLVLATGSRPHIPNIPGNELDRIYRFRDIKDSESLFARLTRSRHTVVVGGGLLGLETAKAMCRYSTDVTVIQHTPGLMNRQLDEEASRRIQSFAEAEGIKFKLNVRVKKIRGATAVQSLLLSDGSLIDCDTLIFATGISPNTEIALDAKIKIRQGIQIDDNLRTSADSVYAIGECADYQGQVFGLVAPGLEQASILAASLMGDTRQYKGSTLVTELKVLGLKVFSMGKVAQEYAGQRDEHWEYKSDECYRRIFLNNNRIVGAVAVGPWNEVKAVQDALARNARLWPWQKLRFISKGQLFADAKQSLAGMPDATIICNCRQVSLGDIRACCALAPATVETLSSELGVGTVCGSCKPLAAQALDQPVELQPVKKGLMSLAIMCAMLLSILLLAPALPLSESVQNPGLDWLWTETFARQVSGFTMLGLTTISLLVSVRKRFSWVKLLSFDVWRNAHVLLTGLALSVLIVHTGISLGSGLNRWLIVDFLLIALVGFGSALMAAMEGKWSSVQVKSAKRALVLGHIVTFWPFPILLGFHIASVYYF